MKRSLQLMIAPIAFAIAATATAASEGGYAAGNFGIAAQFREANGLESRLMVNPPILGKWLQDFGRGRLWIEQDAAPLELKLIEESRLYPRYQALLQAQNGPLVRVKAFAPIGLKSDIGFLPALIVRVTLKSDAGWKGTAGYTLSLNSPEQMSSAFLGVAGVPASAVTQKQSASGLSVSTPIMLKAGVEQAFTFILGYHHPDGYYAAQYPSADKLLGGLAAQLTSFDTRLQEFIAAFPVTGDASIDAYTRWYSSAGILLTKGLRTGEILTMGYNELNQRDSFWASGIHLVFWPDLDKKMILETVDAQLPTGHIPVTILPVIDRGDEIDSAEYFVLRVARHYKLYRDKQLLARAWPAVKRAVEYLHSRDTEGVGVPMQKSYWADWKDVPGTDGRKYAPHFAFLWIATLKEAADLAIAAHEPQVAAGYRDLQKRAEEFINRPFDQGGMWNGTHYSDRWKDGRLPNYVLQDQVVGAVFKVVPADRAQSLFQQLGRNETAWGVRETFPYIPDFAGNGQYGAGEYHNGGIWPYLNFVDVLGRYSYGFAPDAERIIRKVGKADLEAGGDFQPAEFMNGDTGKNMGSNVQAWDAALFSAIYFGAFGIDRVSDTELQLRLRFADKRDFSTRLVLPGASGTLSSHAGKLLWKADGGKRQLPVVVKVFDERPK